MSVYSSAIKIYGQEAFEKISTSKILVVGAGGIGCEILKNLAFSGCRDIELIDLDTIDVSNLNRQFLFRPEHVGQAKATVAGKAAEAFNPDIKVVSHHANIKSQQFSVSYFSKFNIVLNALDNIDARRHVNRLCLAANVPLIDSGTTGYLGQVMPILKGKTACYECFPKPTQKVYPICTIRSTPDKPVHCIVWAKECFKLLFGKPSESMLFEDVSCGDTSTYMHLIALPVGGDVDVLLKFGRDLITALYDTEIKKRIEMEVYKTAKVQPVILSSEVIEAAVQQTKLITAAQAIAPSKVAKWDQKTFSLEECVIEFLLCLLEASSKYANHMGQLSFDKDDAWGMKFITAASNLRSHIFTIPLLSFHDAKGVAGNIIPAIATTNAIVAGIQVMQALKLIAASPAQLDDAKTVMTLCPHTYCLRLPTRKGFFLQPSDAENPVSGCYVCGTAQLTLQIDVTENTLQDLITKVIKQKLSFNEPSIMMGDCYLHEEGEGADEDLKENLSLKLSECPAGGIRDGCVLSIEDFTQDMNVQVVVRHVSNEDLSKVESAAADLFIIGGHDAFEKRIQQQQAATAAAASAAASSSSDATTTGGDSLNLNDDDIMVLDDNDVSELKKSQTAASSISSQTNGVKRDLVEVVEGDSDANKRVRTD